MKTTILLFAFFFAFSILTIAQTTNPLDEKYMPPATSVFGSKLNKTIHTSSNGDNDQPDNALKIPLMEIPRGEFRMLYERKIVNKFSVEVGAGTSFVGDFVNKFVAGFMAGLWGDAIPEYSYFGYDVLPLKVMLDHSNFDYGYLYSFAARYYFSYGNIAPSYVDFTFKKVIQNYDLYGSAYVQSPFSFKNTFLTLNLGSSYQTGNEKIRFIHNLGFGLGAKIGEWDEYLPVDRYSTTTRYFKSGMKRRNITPLISVKYNIGVCW